MFLNTSQFLQKEFRTLNGRTVYANGGITPDVEVDVKPESEVHQALVNKDMFFKYADYYLESHPGVNVVTVDDVVFQDFKNFLSSYGFNYESKAEKKVNELKDMANNKDFSSDYMTYLDKIMQEVESSESGELESAREEIIRSISEEINKRLVEEFAQIEATFPTDKQLQKAVNIINDPAEYNRLLSK